MLAVTGLALAGVAFTAAQPASAGPLAVTSLTSIDHFGNQADFVWTTEPVTLVVTANANVGADILRIVDLDLNTTLVSCTQQATCSVSGVRFSTAQERVFAGELLAGGRVVSTFDLTVTWEDFGVTFQVSQTTVPVGQPVTFTATTTRDIGPSNWGMQVFDLTAGTAVCEVGGGTSCSGSVTENAATTHEFVAEVGGTGTPGGFANIRSQSPHWFVTWSNDGWQVSLTPTQITTVNGQSAEMTVTANRDVGPTPFCIDVFDETVGQLIAGPYGNGTGQSFVFTPRFNTVDYLIAFVAACGTTLPPGSIEASSSVVSAESFLG